MATKAQVAAAFASRLVASCHNAQTSAGIYQLHGHTIAKWDQGHKCEGVEFIKLSWCGFYTLTTASHMNEILKALGAPVRVSYARARDLNTREYLVLTRNGKYIGHEEINPVKSPTF
jgi:hypothetical protein